ncbi:DUF7824 domain-containing protein [Streptomyces fructofermentans]|nr:DUF6493 family protein [Streptomyces fructofermentans]
MSGTTMTSEAAVSAPPLGDALLKAVRAGRTAEVVGLLDGMTDAERRACLPALKELRKELRPARWDSASRRAHPTLHAAGAACHTGAAGTADWLTGADMRWAQASPAVLLHVLGDRERAWLGDVAHRLAERPDSAQVPYELMSGLVRLSGCPLPTTETYVFGWVQWICGTRRRGDTVAQRLRQDPHTAELVTASFGTTGIGGRLDWMFGSGAQDWVDALTQLTREGTLDRQELLDSCAAALLRGGPPADCRVFLRLLKGLEPTRAEELEHVATWMALASDAVSTVASHAQSVLGSLALDGGLTARQLAEMSDAVLFRAERRLVRSQLVLLGKALRRDRSSAAELLPAVARAFGHEDTDVQERALKLVERHIGSVTAEVRAEVAASADLLSAGLRARAEGPLGLEEAGTAPEPYREMLPPAPEPQRLATAPESAAEVAEEVAALLASGGDVAAFERTLDGLVRHSYRDRAALVEALRPAVARRWWFDIDSRYTAVDGYFGAAPHGLEVVLAALFGQVRVEALRKAVQHPPTTESCAHSGPARAFNARLWEAAHRAVTEPQPLLLATPTWASGVLEPDELVSRLDEYRRLGARPGEADLAQALLRVRRDDRAAADAAAARAAALGTPEGDRLARWLATASPSLPSVRRHVSGNRVLLEPAGADESAGTGWFPDELPPEFRLLGLPVDVSTQRRYCSHYWEQSDQQYWLAVLPGQRELVAGRLLNDLSALATDDIRGDAALLPRMAEAEGEAGGAVHLGLAYGLGARHPEDRLGAVDALLVLAARGQLDAFRLGADLGELVRCGAVKPLRLAESVRTAAATGAYATVWAVVRTALPPLFERLDADGATAPPHGLGELVAVAADCAERTGVRGELPHLSRAVDRRGTSRLVTQARRLRTTLDRDEAA